jgi:hypothetical protein
LVLILEPDNQAARTLRNQSWQRFVAQCRSKPPVRPEKQLGAAALGGMTNFRLPAAETMPTAARAPAKETAAEDATEFETSQKTAELDVSEQDVEQSAQETAEAAFAPGTTVDNEPAPAAPSTKASPTPAQVAPTTPAKTAHAKTTPARTAPEDPAAPTSTVAAAHEKQAQQREKELLQQMEEDRRQKKAEFQKQLADSKKEAEERRKKALARLGRRHQEDDNPERMPLWKKGMLAAAACVVVWFLGSWGFEIYANYQAQARFTLAHFCRDFEQDAVRARKKYDGGAFELTGKAKLVYTGREARLALETAEVPQWSVHCRFDLSPESFKKLIADQIEPGQEVTIEGRCSYQPKEGKGIILMEECILRKSGRS